jgi:hypothetical protein
MNKQEELMLRNKKIVVGVTIGVILLLILGLGLPLLLQSASNPFNNCRSSVSFEIDEDFTLSVYNGTDGTPIEENSDQFECLLTILSIIEFDPIIIDAYEKNISEGMPLNETITENIGTYMSYKNVFIANAKLQLFLTMLFEGINGSYPEPTEDELNQLLLPLEREQPVRTSITNPGLLAGVTTIFGNTTWLNVPENINITDFMDIFSNFYMVNIGFLDTINPLNLGIPEALESDFFVDDCSNLNFKLTSLEFNSTIEDDLPVNDMIEWNGELNNQDVSGSNGFIPLNIPALIQFLSLLGSEIF